MSEETWKWVLGILLVISSGIGGMFMKQLQNHADRDDRMMDEIRQEAETMTQDLRRELRAVEHRTNEIHLALLQQVKTDLGLARAETKADIREMKQDLLAAINGKFGHS